MKKHTRKLLMYRRIRKNHLMCILGVVAFVMAIFTIGCSPKEVGSSQETATIPTIEKPQALKIALCIDQSGSANQTRVEKIDSKSILSLFSVIKKGGGELAFCLIRDRSNLPLARLRISSPPIAPISPIKTGKEFEDASNKARYKREEEKHHSLRKKWEEKTDKKITAFLETLEPMIKQARNAPSTDLAGALLRTKTYLSEREVNWKTFKTYIVLVTDGLASSAISPDHVQSGTEMIWINATGRASDLDIFQPIRFESLSAAIRFISESNQS